MLVIRLARTGKKHQAYYRIVVADKRSAVGSKFIEILGNYDPHAKKLSIDKEKLNTYLTNGAQPSNSVAKIFKTEKVEMPKWVKITEKNKAPKKVEEPKTEAPKAEEKPAEEADSGEAEVAETTEKNEEVAEAPVEAEKPATEEAPAKEETAEKTE